MLGIGIGNSPVLQNVSVTSDEPSPLLTDLISYWKMDEASGQRIDSVVLSGNDLTDNNTVLSNTGKINLASQFVAANNEYLSHVDNSSLSTGDIDYTLALWLYFDSKGARNTAVAKDTTAGSGNVEYLLQYDSGPDRIEFVIFSVVGVSTTVRANSLGSPSTSTWYFVVAWHNSSAGSINIQVNDGVTDTQGSAVTPFDGPASFLVSAQRASSPRFFWDGRIDEFGFWKRLLTAQERTDLYNGGSGLSYPFS